MEPPIAQNAIMKIAASSVLSLAHWQQQQACLCLYLVYSRRLSPRWVSKQEGRVVEASVARSAGLARSGNLHAQLAPRMAYGQRNEGRRKRLRDVDRPGP